MSYLHVQGRVEHHFTYYSQRVKLKKSSKKTKTLTNKYVRHSEINCNQIHCKNYHYLGNVEINI